MTAVTSPLTVRVRKHRWKVTDSAGNVVIEGGGGRDVWPVRFVATGPGGTWKIDAPAEKGSHLPLRDPGGREVARLNYVRRQGWRLQLASGELLEAEKGGGLFKAYFCDLEGFSHAQAPYLAPQRHITVTLTDAALAHPLRDAIALAAVWISESTIASLITENSSSD
jgi:hypothetical protein